MSRNVNPSYSMNHIQWDRSGEHAGSSAEDVLAEAEEERSGNTTYMCPDIDRAAEWAAKQMVDKEFNADFSLESLHEVDRFFNEVADPNAAGYGEFFGQNLSFRTFAIGAYVGEVLRRVRDAEWLCDTHDPFVDVNAALDLGEDAEECLPMKQVLLRLNDGPSNSFVGFAQTHGFEVPGEAVVVEEDKPQVPADFEIRGFVTIWHCPADTYEEPEYHFAADTTACVNLLGYFSFLEEKPTPSLKSIDALTEENGIELPESMAKGTLRSQMGVFYDPELPSDFWKLVDSDNQLYVEMGSGWLGELKNAVTKIFLGQETPIIGTFEQSLQLWPKAEFQSEFEEGDDKESDADGPEAEATEEA